MGVARLVEVIDSLFGYSHGCAGTGVKEATRNEGKRVGSPHPPNVPVAITERGRVLSSTLADIYVALEAWEYRGHPG